MDINDFRYKFKQSYQKEEFITFYCRCSITYSGRAEASLEKGDRLVAIKQDGTVIIHQPK